MRSASQNVCGAGFGIAGVLLLLAATLLGGCAGKGRPLMPTPTLYQQEPGKSVLFADTAPERRRPGVELLFVTNRTPETNPESPLPYGEGRSRSLAFGTAVVDMVPGLTWADLEYQSRLPERTRDVFLELGTVTEKGRFPNELYAVEPTDAGTVRSRAVLEAHKATRSQFRELLQGQLRTSPTKEVVL